MHVTKHQYCRGYYQACDDVVNWMNTQDDMTLKEFRSALNHKLLEMHPDKYIHEDIVDISKFFSRRSRNTA